MTMIIIAFAVMLVMMAAMAVGVMMGRKPIGGSCGGIGAAGGDKTCTCGRSGPGTCASTEQTASNNTTVNYTDATKS